jgi:hypothetical protein
MKTTLRNRNASELSCRRGIGSAVMRFGGCLVLLMLFAPIGAWSQDVQVRASIGADTVGINDQVQLTVAVSGKDSSDAGTPRLPRFQGFHLVAGPSVNTQFQWINGQSSSSKSFVYVLLPEKEGTFTIDPVEVPIGRAIFKTQPITLRVTAPSTRSKAVPAGPPGPFDDENLGRQGSQLTGEEVFITADLDRSSSYTGQQATLSYHLYTQVGISGIQLQESAPLTGFWVEDLAVESNPVGETKIIDGREYRDYVIKRQALFPTAAGKLRIPPSTFAVSARMAGDFFGFFPHSESLYRKTKEVFLEVKALPAENRPASFGNAVGSFNMTNSLDKTEVAAGEAVVLRVKLEGRGNLKMIPDIALPSMPDFTIYSSKRSENIRPFDANQIGGDKTWEYVMVPTAPGLQTIPALSFSYFDTQKDAYQIISTAPLSLRVARGADTAASIAGLSGLNKQTLTRQGTDINFIKLSAQDIELQRAPVYRALWFYLLAALPLVSSLAVLLYQREQSHLSVNAVLVRRKKARRKAMMRLKGGVKAGRTEPRRFYDEAAGALEGYLADRFDLPDIAVAGDSLERALKEKAIHEQTIAEVVSCLQECSYGRFVAASGSAEKMKQLAGRIDAVVSALENY